MTKYERMVKIKEQIESLQREYNDISKFLAKNIAINFEIAFKDIWDYEIIIKNSTIDLDNKTIVLTERTVNDLISYYFIYKDWKLELNIEYQYNDWMGGKLLQNKVDEWFKNAVLTYF